MTLGECLKQKRLNKGQTQSEASKELKISQTAYSFIETGKAKPHLKTLLKISQYIKKPMSWCIKHS